MSEPTKDPLKPCICCRAKATHVAKNGNPVCDKCGPGYAFRLAGGPQIPETGIDRA